MHDCVRFLLDAGLSTFEGRPGKETSEDFLLGAGLRPLSMGGGDPEEESVRIRGTVGSRGGISKGTGIGCWGIGDPLRRLSSPCGSTSGSDVSELNLDLISL